MQGWDLWIRQEEQRRDVMRQIVKIVGAAGCFDPAVKLAGNAITTVVKPNRKSKTQAELDAVLKTLENPIGRTAPVPPPPVDPLAKKSKGDESSSDDEDVETPSGPDSELESEKEVVP